MNDKEEQAFVESTKKIIADIQARADPFGWVTITEKRREGRIDECHLAVSFKFKQEQNR